MFQPGANNEGKCRGETFHLVIFYILPLCCTLGALIAVGSMKENTHSLHVNLGVEGWIAGNVYVALVRIIKIMLFCGVFSLVDILIWFLWVVWLIVGGILVVNNGDNLAQKNVDAWSLFACWLVFVFYAVYCCYAVGCQRISQACNVLRDAI